jgi:hypothetical protein
MSGDRPTPTTPTGKARFGLRTVFAALTASSVVLGVCVQIPRPALRQAIGSAPALIICSALLVLLPLTCINLVCVAIACVSPAVAENRSASQRLRWWAPYRLLWQAGAAKAPTFRMAIPIALICTLLLPILWPFLREFGLALALWLSHGYTQDWPTLAAIPRLMTNGSFLARLFRWELWSILRWWLLFGAWTAAWLAIAWPLRRRWQIESAPACYRRLLAFAPWFVVLEIAFLVGVWTQSPLTVPEPSTGFVEGIFSWDLWHWDCWKGSGWINRGFLPSWISATFFARFVLRWRWPAAVAVAACVVPLALVLSVAWTVLYI